MYGHLFNKELSEQEISFDSLFVVVNDKNKHVVIPMLMKLAQQDEQKTKLRELCERIMFDITAIESGVHPDPYSKTNH
jgi:hypothetical protein